MKSPFFIANCTILSILTLFGVQAQNDVKKLYNQPLQDIFLTELVYPQEKNEFQFTLAPQFQKNNKNRLLTIPLKAEYGITNSWQLELEWNYQHKSLYSESDLNGMGDLQFGTKYSFMNVQNLNFHMAIGFDLTIPTGNEAKELSEGTFEYEPFFIMALDLPTLNNAQLFSQLGIGFMQKKENNAEINPETSEANEFNLNFGFFAPLKQGIFTSEINWFTNKWNHGHTNQLYYTPGMVWNLKSWEAGIGFPIGLNKQSDNYRAIAMLTYEFNISEDND